MPITLRSLNRYPIKGLTAQSLDSVEVAAGGCLPLDRAWALAHGASQYDPGEPAWMPKRNFLNLMRHERLAALTVSLDEASGLLVIARDGKPVARGNITTPVGVSLINQFFAAYMKDEGVGAPKLVQTDGIHFTDSREPFVSIINAASVADLERVARGPVDPMRFRGNLLIDGAAPWAEMQWPGRALAIGPVRLRVVEPIERCAATTVNPATAERDLNVLGLLSDGYNHTDCGVFAEVVEGGRLSVGDEVVVPD